MSQTTQNAAANANDADRKDSLYNLAGTISELEFRASSKNTPYFYAKLLTRIGGKAVTVTTMGFGKALESVRNQLVEGGAVRFYGKFERGTEGGRTFAVVGAHKQRQQAGPQARAA